MREGNNVSEREEGGMWEIVFILFEFRSVEIY